MGRVQAVLSTETKDRNGDIIRQEGWDIKSFLLHPVLLTQHNYDSILAQIGEWEDVAVKGKRLIGTAKYYIGDGNEEADWAFKLAQKGRAAFSVGFIADMAKAKELDSHKWQGAFEFMGQELLEVSQVTIPANAEALQQMKALRLHPIVSAMVAEELGDHASRLEIPQPDEGESLNRIADALMNKLRPELKMLLSEMQAQILAGTTPRLSWQEELSEAIAKSLRRE
mgnify:FL=1